MNTKTGVTAMKHGPVIGRCQLCGDHGKVGWRVEGVGKAGALNFACTECANLQIAAELEKQLASIMIAQERRKGATIRKLKGFLGWDGEEEGGAK